MKTPYSVWLWPMAPVHFPPGRAYRLRGCSAGIDDARQGVSLSRQSLPSTTQKERESTGMKRGTKKVEGGGGGMRGTPLLLSRKVIG